MFVVQVLVDVDGVEYWAKVREFVSFSEARRYKKTHDDGELVLRNIEKNEEN